MDTRLVTNAWRQSLQEQNLTCIRTTQATQVEFTTTAFYIGYLFLKTPYASGCVVGDVIRDHRIGTGYITTLFFHPGYKRTTSEVTATTPALLKARAFFNVGIRKFL
jgi:hypothetical protein